MASPGSCPKGILKKTSSLSNHDPAHRHAVWDEHNLEVNEEIKAQLAPRRIIEPKTPYIAPLDIDAELEADMTPLNLDGEGAASAPPAPKPAEQPSEPAECDMETNGNTTVNPEVQHQKFENKRKEHYNMRDALRRGRELAEQEEED